MGERSGIAADESQLLKRHNNNMHFYWLIMIKYWASVTFFAFYLLCFGLLRAFRAAAVHHTAK